MSCDMTEMESIQKQVTGDCWPETHVARTFICLAVALSMCPIYGRNQCAQREENGYILNSESDDLKAGIGVEVSCP